MVGVLGRNKQRVVFFISALCLIIAGGWGCSCDLRRPSPPQDGIADNDGGDTERQGIELVGVEQIPTEKAPDGTAPDLSRPDGTTPDGTTPDGNAPDDPTGENTTSEFLADGPVTTENPPSEPIIPDNTTGGTCQGAGQTNYTDLLLEMKNRKGYIQIPVAQANVCITGAACQESCIQTTAQGEYAFSQIPNTTVLRWDFKHPDFDPFFFYGTHEAIERHRRITNPFQIPRKDTLKPFLEPVIGEALDPNKGILLYFLGKDGLSKPDVKLSTTSAKGPHLTINFFSINGFYANVAPGSYTLEAVVDAQTICVPELAESIARDNTARIRIEAGKITYVTFLCKDKP